MSHFSENIKKLRQEKEMSQEELASSIGVTRLTISNYEQGRREPDFQTLCKFSNFFNCSTDFLLGQTQYRSNDDAASLDYKVQDLIMAMQELPLSEREYLYLLLLDMLKNYRLTAHTPEYRKHQLYSIMALCLSANTLTTFIQSAHNILHSEDGQAKDFGRIQDFSDMSYKIKVDMIKTIDAIQNLFAKELTAMARREGLNIDMQVDFKKVTSMTKENLEKSFSL